eukprot:comp21251_c2_seq1/m.28960 comp21251_c2_seq1/g.28960  ORF comp21251_c2_seq1/g.28960 comp21251_c2_seq1/m.28960 type:complete len:350 (-) comp21251_c2_seq1:520-1569(-)
MLGRCLRRGWAKGQTGLVSAGCRWMSTAGVQAPDSRIVLSNRTVLELKGNDTAKFLQNLITNDVNSVTAKSPCMWAAVLNSQGRVLYDLFVHLPLDHARELKEGDTPTRLLVDCDAMATESLLAHFKKYKIRSKVEFTRLEDSVVHSVLGSATTTLDDADKTGLRSAGADPRLGQLGWRLIGPKDLKDTSLGSVPVRPVGVYHQHRYRLGVPEGMQDIATGEAFPLESNFDILHGVNFDKGCYLGQELTARAKFVGATRKRLMPIIMHPALTPDSTPAPGTSITYNGKAVGKFRSGIGPMGLALLRLESVSGEAAMHLQMEVPVGPAVTVQTLVPDWWPQDVLKSPPKW